MTGGFFPRQRPSLVSRSSPIQIPSAAANGFSKAVLLNKKTTVHGRLLTPSTGTVPDPRINPMAVPFAIVDGSSRTAASDQSTRVVTR